MKRAIALLVLSAAASLAFAQQHPSYPSRPIKLIVPFTPGSASDILARTVGEKMSANWGQPVVIENRPGAGGTIGTGVVAKAEPDGHTLAIVSAGHVVNPVVYGTLPYDTLRDFAGVMPLANLPSVLAVPSTLNVKTVAELVTLAKSKPGQLNYASGGTGAASHVNAEKFRFATGIDMVHVPLKGAPEMVTETMTGRTQLGFFPIVAALPSIKDGRLVALAVSSARRSPVLPEVPAMTEVGVPDAVFDFWIGMLAPAKTPREIVAKLNSELQRIVRSPEVRERYAKLGADPMPMSPAEFDAYMKEEFDTLGRVMRAAGVKTQ